MISDAPTISDLREPRSNYEASQRSRHRQLARIICHLRDELHHNEPKLSMPTRWMVESLVFNAWDDQILRSSDWESMVLATLKTVRSLINSHLRGNYVFTQRDNANPLFPNDELFDEWDAFRFCQSLIQHMEQALQADLGGPLDD